MKLDGPIGHHLQELIVDSRSDCEKDSISAWDPKLGDFLIFFGNERRKGHFTIPEGQVVVLPVVVANAELLVHGQRDGRQSAHASVQREIDTAEYFIHLRLDPLQVLSADLDLFLELLLRRGVLCLQHGIDGLVHGLLEVLVLRQCILHHVENALTFVRFVLDCLIVLQALRDVLRQERILVDLDRLLE